MCIRDRCSSDDAEDANADSSHDGQQQERQRRARTRVHTLTALGVQTSRWRDAARKIGAIPPRPFSQGHRQHFFRCFEIWLRRRGLQNHLVREEDADQSGDAVYRYLQQPIVEAQRGWITAFHGTWWYAAWSILETGGLIESVVNTYEPGVYCSHDVDMDPDYGRAHIIFGDGAYHRIFFELLVDPLQRRYSRSQYASYGKWIFPSSAVSLRGVRIEVNARVSNWQERLLEWEPALEILPVGVDDYPEPVLSKEVEVDVDHDVWTHEDGSNKESS